MKLHRICYSHKKSCKN